MVSKLLDGLVLLLLGILIGFNILLSFFITPTIFSNLDRETAGNLVSLIFPKYFISGWIIGIIIYTFIGFKSIKDKEIIKNLKWFLVGIAIIIILYMAEYKTVLPLAEHIREEYLTLLKEGKEQEALNIKSTFSKIHIISTIINFSNLIIALYLFLYFYYKTVKNKN